ncbi:MAG: helix-turn-helix domain-containing protein [Halobacteriales archaeon]
MSVIVTLSIPPTEFELGRILDVRENAVVSLESIVPLGEQSIPFFRIRGGREFFEASARDHQSVNNIRLVSTHDGEALYALDWAMSDDVFFQGIVVTSGYLLDATGTPSEWTFDLRFRSHESLEAFQEYCVDESIPMDVQRIYNPTKPEAGPWYGLSGPQRETLARAVERRYYDIPRQCSTKELASDFDLSDQAVIERLRRGIGNLVTNTILESGSEP